MRVASKQKASKAEATAFVVPNTIVPDTLIATLVADRAERAMRPIDRSQELAVRW